MEGRKDTLNDFLGSEEQLHRALLRLAPDPVDVFEDLLAEELGIERPAPMLYADWRRYRVRAIEEISWKRPATVVKAKVRAERRARRSRAS